MTKTNWSEVDAILERIMTLKKEGETDNAFATRCGLSPANLSKAKKHQNGIGTLYLKRIASTCDVNLEWLQTGEGDKHDVTNNESRFASESAIQQQSFHPRKTSAKQPEISKDDLLDSLKAENEAMRSVLDTVKDIIPILQQTLQQNAEVLAQNKQLMAFIGARFQNS